MAVADMPAAVDHIGFGHSIDPEVNRRRAVAIDGNAVERVAEFPEKASGVGGPVFIGDAV